MNYANNAYSVLSGGISNVATVINVAAGTGSRFPASNFLATLVGYDVNGNENAWEIVLCTSRTSDALTVTRAKEGTTAVAWADATRIENRVTAGTMAAFEPGITAGTTAQYLRGNKSWRDFFTDVRAATLTGLSTATNAVIGAADTVLGALGKLQAQVSSKLNKSGDTMTGDLKFSGARKIIGDMSSSTALASRLSLQSSVANGSTDLTAIPNGTSTRAGFGAINASSTTNHGYFSMLALSTDMRLWSGKSGSGTVLPMTFYTGNSERAKFRAAGGLDLATGLREAKVAMGASAIDLAAGNYFTKTISGATTLTASNVPATGTAASFILELTNAGSAAITWFSGVKWAGGTAPTLTASGVDVLGFYTHNGGTTWRGFLLSKNSK